MFSALPTVFVIFEIKTDGRQDLIACIDDRDRAMRLHESARCVVREMVVNPLGGSYLAKLEKDIERARTNVNA
jgi:hypothetical protein